MTAGPGPTRWEAFLASLGAQEEDVVPGRIPGVFWLGVPGSGLVRLLFQDPRGPGRDHFATWRRIRAERRQGWTASDLGRRHRL